MNISIVIPTIGRKYLDSAVKSIRATEGGNQFEIIIVDDSIGQNVVTDDPNTKIVRNGGNRGYFPSLSIGFKEARGKFVALHNDDDLSTNSRFIQQHKMLETSDAAFAICGIKKFGATKISSHSNWLAGLHLRKYSPAALAFGPIGSNATLMISKEKVPEDIFDGFGKDDLSDWIFGLQNYYKYGIVATGEVGYLYRQHDDQITKRELDQSTIEMASTRVLDFCSNLSLPTLETDQLMKLCLPTRINVSNNEVNWKVLENWFRQYLQATPKSTHALLFQVYSVKKIQLIVLSSRSKSRMYWKLLSNWKYSLIYLLTILSAKMKCFG